MNSGHNHLVTKIEIYIADLVCIVFAYYFAIFLRNKLLGGDVMGKDTVILLFFISHTVISLLTNPYHRFLLRNKYTEIVRTLQHVGLVFIMVIMIAYLLQIDMNFSRLAMGIMVLTSAILLYGERVVLKRIRRSHLRASEYVRKMLVVTTSDRVKDVLAHIGVMSTYDYRITSIAIVDTKKIGTEYADIPVVATKDTLLSYVTSNPIDEVLISIDENHRYVSELTDKFLDMGLSVDADIQDMWESYPNARLVCLGDNNHILASTHSFISDRDALIKRAIDIVGSICGLAICAVLTVFVAPVIFIKSPGPIFFTQTRVGLNGRKFKIYKFRSMYLDAEERKKELMASNEMDGLMFKVTDDPRIIKGVGHFIRKSSIDEFPQFLNVLKGDMSLVGTRPPTEDEYEKYEPHHKARLSMRPGLTGLWQVSGRSSITDFDEVVKLDKAYIMNWSLGKDIEILFRTLKVVFLRVGAR